MVDRLPYEDIAQNSLNFNKIPLMVGGFGTFGVTDPHVIFNALSVGGKHKEVEKVMNCVVRTGRTQALGTVIDDKDVEG